MTNLNANHSYCYIPCKINESKNESFSRKIKFTYNKNFILMFKSLILIIFGLFKGNTFSTLTASLEVLNCALCVPEVEKLRNKKSQQVLQGFYLRHTSPHFRELVSKSLTITWKFNLKFS